MRDKDSSDTDDYITELSSLINSPVHASDAPLIVDRAMRSKPADSALSKIAPKDDIEVCVLMDSLLSRERCCLSLAYH